MSDNENNLRLAQLRAGEFRATGDPDKLHQAINALSQLSPETDANRATATAFDLKALHSWLSVLDLIDRHRDPAFDPNAPLFQQVSPPAVGEVRLMPGADPELIRDPVAREKYKADIAANDRKLQQARLQTRLRKLEPDVVEAVHDALCQAYRDRSKKDALTLAVNELIGNQTRKAELLEFIAQLK